MGLETIVNGFERYSSIKGISQSLSQSGQDPVARAQIYQQLGGFIKKYEPAGASGVDPIIEDIITNERNTLAGQMIGEQANVSQDLLLKEVNDNYKSLVQAIDPKTLVQIAAGLDKNVKKYKELFQSVNGENMDQVKDEFVKYYEDKKCPTIARYINRINDLDMIKKYAFIFLSNAQNKVVKELYDEVEETTGDGKKKKVAVLNADKARKYILNKIESSEDRGEIYLTLAGTYAQSQAKKK